MVVVCGRSTTVETKARVVIVGGSFAGLQTATELSPYHSQVDIIVIDSKDYFEFTPSIHTAIAGNRKPEPLLRLLDTQLVRHVNFVQGTAVDLDAEKVTVSRTDNITTHVPYDILVVATGCTYTAPIRASASEYQLTDRLESLRRVSTELDAASSVLVVGGGAVGVEICGELACRGKQVTLATNTSELVTDCPVAIRTKVLSALKAKGVAVRFDCRASQIGDKKYALQGDTEEIIDADECLWCFGAKPRTEFCTQFLGCDHRGFVLIDPDTRRCTSDSRCYAAGDVAAKPDAQRLASYAHLEGEFVAHQIIAELSQVAPPRPYTAPPRFVALSLGPRDGAFIYDSLPFPIPGFLVPWLKLVIENWFIRLLPMPYAILKLLPGDHAARIWAKDPPAKSSKLDDCAAST